MTTIAANRDTIAADTRVGWEGIGSDIFTGQKLFAAKNGNLYGWTGNNCTGSIRAMEWLLGDRPLETKPLPPEYEHDWDWRLIELSKEGISIYNEYLEREVTLEPMLAVGSGRKVALYCMKYLNMTPAQAVHEACKVDCFSGTPIYTASLSDPKVKLWKPTTRRSPKGAS